MQCPPTIHPGVTEEARWRTFEMGNIRVRIVEYTSGYLADHWCSRGHVLLVLEGELVTELDDGRKFTLVIKLGMNSTRTVLIRKKGPAVAALEWQYPGPSNHHYM